MIDQSMGYSAAQAAYPKDPAPSTGFTPFHTLQETFMGVSALEQRLVNFAEKLVGSIGSSGSKAAAAVNRGEQGLLHAVRDSAEMAADSVRRMHEVLDAIQKHLP